MIQISPQLKVRIRVRQLCDVVGDELGIGVYNYLPDERADYPFIHIGEQFKQNERIHIDSLNGRTQLTIHVWHNDTDKEGALLNIMNKIEQSLIVEYGLNGEDIDTQFIVDNTTGSSLLHGIIEVEIKY